MLAAPFAHFTEAAYAPFSTIRSIRFDVQTQLGITRIDVNHQDPEPQDAYFVSRFRHYSAYFSRPPESSRYVLCGMNLLPGHAVEYPYVQFEIDGEWKPPLPSSCVVLKPPVLVRNVVGIWWGESYPFVRLHIGMVVSNKADLRNVEV